MAVRGIDDPSWTQLIVTILKTSGPIALIAFVLIYYLMQSVTSHIDEVHEAIQKSHDEIVSAKVEMHAFATTHSQNEIERARQQSAMLQVLRQMCVNTADGPAARAGCYVEGK